MKDKDNPGHGFAITVSNIGSIEKALQDFDSNQKRLDPSVGNKWKAEAKSNRTVSGKLSEHHSKHLPKQS